MVDQSSGGRVDVVVGLGYVRSEYPLFGLEASDRVRLLEEKLPVYLHALERTATPPLVERPRPTVLLAASVPAAARRAARLADGMHALVPREMLERDYLAERARLGLDAGRIIGGDGSRGRPRWSPTPVEAGRRGASAAG